VPAAGDDRPARSASGLPAGVGAGAREWWAWVTWIRERNGKPFRHVVSVRAATLRPQSPAGPTQTCPGVYADRTVCPEMDAALASCWLRLARRPAA